MDNMGQYLTAIAQRAKAASPEHEGDYEKDGLLFCGNCHTAKQTRIQLPFLDGERVVSCLCQCAKKQRELEEELRKQRELEIEIRKNRSAAFPEADFRNCTFETDDGGNPDMTRIARNYVANFREMLKSGKGLLLYGDVGRGKTFAAACIANALLDQGHPALMTNFSRIANTTSGMFEGKQEYLDSLNKYSLLVLDDLSAERKTEFMQEVVYNVIDARYRARKPLIVTTNLSMEELKNPAEITSKRIFDRVLEMTIPVEVKGKNKRYEKINSEYDRMKALLEL